MLASGPGVNVCQKPAAVSQPAGSIGKFGWMVLPCKRSCPIQPWECLYHPHPPRFVIQDTKHEPECVPIPVCGITRREALTHASTRLASCGSNAPVAYGQQASVHGPPCPVLFAHFAKWAGNRNAQQATPVAPAPPQVAVPRPFRALCEMGGKPQSYTRAAPAQPEPPQPGPNHE